MDNVRKICITGMGIALFVVFTLCLQVPVFENYYLCLGYIVMAVYCYCVGTVEGTIVGVLGVILCCLLTSGLRGMPGWAAGNVVIGLALGTLFRFTVKMKPSIPVLAVSVTVIFLSCAAGILGVKSCAEWLLYSQPFLLRAGKNIYAFWADAFVLVISLPLCRVVDRKIRGYM
jgi:uncharacterized membrane protein